MTTAIGTPTDFQQSIELFKRIYAKRLEDLVPPSDIMAKEIPFVPAAQKMGREYIQPVCLTREMGITFNGGDGTAFDINKAIGSLELSATISGTEIVVTSQFSYAFLTRAQESLDGTKAGVKAFVNGTKYKYDGLVRGASFAREISILYGGGPSAVHALGTVLNTTGSSGTTLIVEIAASDWALGLWAGSERGHFDIYNGTSSTKRNSAGTAGTEEVVYKLGKVTAGTRKLQFASHATNVSAVAAGDTIFLHGQRAKDCLGLIGACLTTGALWNINTTDYNLWAPRTHAVNGQLTFEQLMQGVAKLAEIGFVGTLNVHVSPATWTDLNNDQAAMVEHADKAGGTVELGFTKIVYHGQTGKVVIKNNMYMKRGYALALPEGYCMRIGSCDITNKIPGYGELFMQTPGKAGLETQVYSDQAPFCERPAYMLLLTGITNSTDA
jgi:hypothetical protein